MGCAHSCTSCRLDRIEELLVEVLKDSANERRRENTHYQQILERFNTMATTVAELAAKIDAATNDIGAKLDAESIKLDTEAAAIAAVQVTMKDLRDQLATAGVPQAVLDQLDASATRLSGAAQAIDKSTTTIDNQVSQLQVIAADPNNPVPVPSQAAKKPQAGPSTPY